LLPSASDMGTVQLKLPLLGVEAAMIAATVLPLKSRILTLPEMLSVQVMVFVGQRDLTAR